MSKPLDELPIVPHQAQKGLDFYVSLGRANSTTAFKLSLLDLFGDMMSQIVNLFLEEFALCGFQLQVVFLEVTEHNMQVLYILLLYLWEDYHIIQIDWAVH